MRYWLCVTIPENWEIVKEKRKWGVDDRYQVTLKENVSVGDIFVFYVTGGGIAGIYKVNSPYSYDNTPLGWINKKGEPYVYPHRVDVTPVLLPEEPVQLNQEFRRELIFITDKSKTWQVFVFPSMVLISKEDFEIVERKLKSLGKRQ